MVLPCQLVRNKGVPSPCPCFNSTMPTVRLMPDQIETNSLAIFDLGSKFAVFAGMRGYFLIFFLFNGLA